jgi:hypothetical protein
MNEKVIWDFLLDVIGNEYGTAAVMGNLMAESSLNPRCVTGTSDKDYTERADTGVIDFARDARAYGLVQWCYHTRKEGLLAYAKSTGRSVGHLQMQLEYMVCEMRTSYKTVWEAVTKATDIRTASDVVMLKYEKPATTTEAAKKKRAEYGQKFYNQFAVVRPLVIATANVRIRSGDSTGYPQVGSLKKGQSLEWVTTSRGFHAVRMKDRIGWVSGEFSEVRYV